MPKATPENKNPTQILAKYDERYAAK